MLTIITFLIILGIVVLVHELGHFVTAKAANVKVLEFGFGFPPRLFGIRRGETLYSLNLLPLGGFVKMEGEEDPSHPRSLASKPVWVRFLVLVAGPGMNALLPLVLFAALFMVHQQTVVGQVRVNEVVPDSPAAAAGVQVGDIIVRANDREIENFADLYYVTQLNLGREMTWTLLRDGSRETIHVVPRFKTPEGQGATGITIETINPQTVSRSDPFWKAVPRGAERVGEVLILFKNGITQLIVGGARWQDQVAGPIGIAQLTGEVAKAGVIPLVEFTAFLSVWLAVLNILPIPMLDGGRLTFVILEMVRRGKRISPQKEGLVHLMGFVLLISMMVVISYFDILRILRGDSLLR